MKNINPLFLLAKIFKFIIISYYEFFTSSSFEDEGQDFRDEDDGII